MNLSNNPTKKIDLILRSMADDCFLFEVQDNGCGIAEENLAKLFIHGFTTKKEGHGCGLHVSALAIKDMGGTLSARSDGINQEATFSITLPCHPLVVKQEEVEISW